MAFGYNPHIVAALQLIGRGWSPWKSKNINGVWRCDDRSGVYYLDLYFC